MTKFLKVLITSTISLSVLLGGCAGSLAPGGVSPEQTTVQPSTSDATQKSNTDPGKTGNTSDSTGTSSPDVNSGAGDKENNEENLSEIDFEKVKPNEAGKVMVVMFHRFIEKYTSGDKEYVTTFDEFRNLLQTLYDKGYSLVSMKDFLNNNIDIPAGRVPIVFTFDDGTPGQFNLVEENGELVASRKSAAGIMMEFNEKHPDFGLEGTFYVTLGGGTFEGGTGTLAEKLKYLIDNGFEIGNHTYNHMDFWKIKTAEEVQMEIGANQKKMDELVPGYKMETLALPLGHIAKDKSLRALVGKGEYEGVEYQNYAVVEIGANPTLTPASSKYNPLSTPRVRASGIRKVEADLSWWLDNMSRSQEYVSDGNPDTIAVPEEKEADIDKSRIGNKKVVTY